MKWIVSCVCLVLLSLPAMSFAQSALLQVSATHQQDTQRTFSGVDGLEVARLATKLHMPVFASSSFVGDWFAAAQLSENRFALSGSVSDTRRLYRFSLPIEFEQRPSGRWQHFWQFASTYFTDESLLEQTRYVNEFAWQVRYQANRKVSWVAGIRQDSLFADTQIYPVFGLISKPNSKIYHHWVFPNIYSQVTLNRRHSIRLYMEPEGGNWLYRQADGTDATLGFTHWKLGFDFNRALLSPLQLKLAMGLTMRGEGSIAGADGDLGDGYFFLLGIESRFSQ
jgi:hypothetical protein